MYLSTYDFRDTSQHTNHLPLVLEHLLEYQLYVKAEKCEFHVPTVSILGFIFEAGNIRPDPAKVTAVTSPPTQLTSVNKPYIWSSEAQSAFVKLKDLCLSSHSHSA